MTCAVEWQDNVRKDAVASEADFNYQEYGQIGKHIVRQTYR